MPKLLLSIILLGCTVIANAQQNVISAGTTASSPGGSISYSIGQIDFIAFDNTTNAGVQQAYSVIPFPVTWLNFTAVKQENAVLLNWQTASEINTSQFILYHSVNGYDFNVELGSVNATGNSVSLHNYSLKDNYPFNGMNYYRLKQVDKNGSFSYSAIVAVNFESGFKLSCYPNPFTSFLTIDIGSVTVSATAYTITDFRGKVIKTGYLARRVTILPLSGLPTGAYIFKVANSLSGLSIPIIKQ